MEESSIICNEPVNRGRQAEIDLAKFVVVFLIIGCHAGMAFYDPVKPPFSFVGYSIPYTISGLLGAEFAAPVLMVCLGLGSIYSKNNEPKQLAKRGIRLFLYGYLFNFIRGTIPALIGLATGYTYTAGTVLETLTVNEILMFAGLSFMILALFKKLNVKPIWQFLISILFAALGEMLAFHSTGNYYLDQFFLLFWGTCSNAHFTFLNWYIFVAAGAVFGQILERCKDKTALYTRLFIIGAVGVFISYYQIVADYRVYYGNDGNFFLMGIKVAILALFYPMLLFSICYFISGKINPSTPSLVRFCARNLTSIYVVSWVLTTWARYICLDVLKLSLNTWVITAGIVVLYFCTLGIVKLYRSWGRH